MLHWIFCRPISYVFCIVFDEHVEIKLYQLNFELIKWISVLIRCLWFSKRIVSISTTQAIIIIVSGSNQWRILWMPLKHVEHDKCWFHLRAKLRSIPLNRKQLKTNKTTFIISYMCVPAFLLLINLLLIIHLVDLYWKLMSIYVMLSVSSEFITLIGYQTSSIMHSQSGAFSFDHKI